jgi:hypothetical protein
MDGIKPRGSRSRVMAARVGGSPVAHMRHIYKTHITQPKPGRARKIVRHLGRLAAHERKRRFSFKRVNLLGLFRHIPEKHRPKAKWEQVYAVAALFLFLFSLFSASIQPFLDLRPYPLNDRVRAILPEQGRQFTPLLKYTADSQAFEYNATYTGSYDPDSALNGEGTPRFNATIHKDPSKGVAVRDPLNDLAITLKPRFRLEEGQQSQNQILYRMGDGLIVYTAQVSGLKEDIVLNKYAKDRMVYEYELSVPEGTEARLEPNGAISVYGSDLPGSISTGSEEDAKLLAKARQKAEKNRLVFTIPAPVVVEFDRTTSKVRSHFELEGNRLRIVAEGLKGANYPLSIDPSIYVESAEKLMRGNNETNIDFDVDNELIKKGKTTGARFDALNSTLSLPAARWNHGTAASGGYVYTVGGSDGTTAQSTVYWAKFNKTNYTVEAPNPGAGACASWCTNSAYNLPAARTGFSLVAYNGFLYVLGGFDSSGVRSDAVYIAKLGANGEPSLWHPTDSNQANWVYWYQAGNLSSARGYPAAVAYNNRLYLMGGTTSASTGGVTTVEYTNISPTGGLGSWSSTGMTALPSARFGHTAQVYNNRIYVIGGNSSGTLQATVHYIKLNSDGTMVSTWAQGADFNRARMGWGGNFSTIWGGYIYIMGGCTQIDAEGECTSTGITDGGNIELASINADGSIAYWGAVLNVTNAKIGYGLVGWRNTLYTVGGCTVQNTTTGACTTTSTASTYGVINQDGDASTVGTSVASGSGTCTGTDPYNCNLPGTTYIGNVLSMSTVLNGHLYIIGGCTNNACSTASGNTAYVAINSDGSLSKPASCAGGAYQGNIWCVDSTDPISGGVLAAGVTVFDNKIYIIGGQSGGALKGNTYYATVNNDGSLAGPWTAQTFTSIGATSVSYTFAYSRANPATAGSVPGNLYIFGGCNGSASGAGCPSGSNTQTVYKCSIETDGDLSACTTTGQLQIGTVTGASGTGLALHSGTVYAGFIYLVGGVAPGQTDLKTVRYAKLDNSNNVVAVSGSTWIESANQMSIGRRRGTTFGYNGYLYVVGGYDGSGGGLLSDIQFAKIDVSNGSIAAFQTSAVTINQRWGLTVPVSSSFAYVIGGCTAGSSPDGCTARTDTIQTFQIYNNDSGAPANYVSSGNIFSIDRFGAGSAIYNGYIYVAGGCIGSRDCNNATNSVEYAALNADGTIGTWSTVTGALPADRAFGQLEQVGGTLYYIGGQDDSEVEQADVYYAAPSGGDISSWSTATNGLPAARTMLSAAVWNGRIYATGGANGGVGQSTVYTSPSLTAGGNITSTWSSGTAFNVARSGHTAVAYANNLYILAGYDGTNYLSDVQYTQINSDGTLDSWSYTTSLPGRVRLADGFATNGYMYLFGGKSSEILCNNNTYVAPISANTTIASGNNPTGLGEWSLINERFSVERSGVSATYYEGKAYILGGACGTLEGLPGSNVLTDDFDAALDATMWTSTTNMGVGTVCGTVASGNALYSNGNSTAQAISKDVDVLYGGTVTFYLRIPTVTAGGCDAPETGEDLVLQYSVNGGAGWTTFATYNESNFNTATSITESIPSGARTPSTRFRWYIPNADNNQDEWAIDNVDIVADSVPPLDEIFEDDFDATIDAGDWSSTTGMSVGTVCGTIGTGNSLYSTGGTSQAVTNNVDLRYGGVVEFALRIPQTSGGGCDQPESDEDVTLQYSINNGGSWTTFATYNQAQYDPADTVALSIPQTAWSTTVRFRWYIPNAENGSDQWAIDDISISAFQPRLTYANIHRMVYSTLLSQPQVAQYSRIIDADSNVFPTTWLMNGIDNSIGARWQLRYRSSTAEAAVWGQETNFGTITLGQPENYIPLDGSGANTNFARYYYFMVNIDASQTFGYPEDVQRGPTINDLTLFFTADPSKRLRHGKTFTGGEQQPLDTPCAQSNFANCPVDDIP